MSGDNNSATVNPLSADIISSGSNIGINMFVNCMNIRGTTTPNTRNKWDKFIRRYTNKYLIRIRMLVITPYNDLSYKRDWFLAQKTKLDQSQLLGQAYHENTASLSERVLLMTMV